MTSLFFQLTWMMNRQRLLQMQGAGHEVTVLHFIIYIH
jgi:hypothetical protein